ncbi:PrgI family protein [Candidatus Saccharibacteria bacterium]|nr:PrgI family protein [Candidatus Saccharibacteria bacterium]
MAQYKVPQDVEADDKLLGPFSFRQFVYLMIAGGLVATAVGLFQLFPILAILPIPFAVFFLALALPLKKDQPMETYLAAVVSYHLKPHARHWMPGQKENPIIITAPKTVEPKRARDITGEEATHRLSFLADIVDTEGYAIKGAGASPMREDLIAEAEATPDMFETYQSQVINRVIDQDKMTRHQAAVKEMQNVIAKNTVKAVPENNPNRVWGEKTIERQKITRSASPTTEQVPQSVPQEVPEAVAATPAVAVQPEPTVVPEVSPAPTNMVNLRSNAVLKPDVDIDNTDVVIRPEMASANSTNKKLRVPGAERFGVEMDAQAGIASSVAGLGTKPSYTKKVPTKPVNDSIMELANNSDFSVATIAKEANRINRKENGEIFVSLH